MKIIVFCMCCILANVGFSETNKSFSHRGNTPDNLTIVLTFVATTPIDSVDGSFFKDGLVGGDGKGFFSVEQNNFLQRDSV
ncbi:MAG: hypothetical protein ACI93R_001945 [Flavobacteriales bacterium]|jgi:hypothetical protein